VEHTVAKESAVPESLETHLVLPLSQTREFLASELYKEEPPCDRHTSGRDETLASELDADTLRAETRS